LADDAEAGSAQGGGVGAASRDRRLSDWLDWLLLRHGEGRRVDCGGGDFVNDRQG